MTLKTITDHDIVNYLSLNNDFFVRHPEQLEVMQVSLSNGTVTSLVNHQVNVLKQRNRQLKSHLAELIKNAQDNEKIMSQVFELTLQLCQISHISNVTKHFGRFVQKSFVSDLFKIVMPDNDNLDLSSVVKCVKDEDEYLTIFKDFIQNSIPICGRLKQDKIKFIFGKQADKVGSCVILPIGAKAQKGLLVFASFDESRFNPDMSTDLLLKLTHILERKFKNTFTIPKEVQAQ